MSQPANIRVATSVPFPAQVKGSGVIAIAKRSGVWTVSLNFAALPLSVNVPNPLQTYTLVWDAGTGVFYLIPLSALSQQKIVKVLDGSPGLASPYNALPTDDVLIVNQGVGAPFTINVNWALRTNPLRVVDGKGDAAANNISVVPGAGQTQLAIVNHVYKIMANAGSIILTPLPDATGAY